MRSAIGTKPRGQCTEIIDHIVKEFASNIHPNNNTKILARLPIRSIWTTNYDCLIEEALKSEGKSIDIVVGNKGWNKPFQSDVTVYKMHGTIDDRGHQDLVFTRRHYEEYASKYQRMWEELRKQLQSYSFLFIGFGFADPNVRFALALARNQGDKSTSPHFLIARKEKDIGDRYLTQKFELWVKDLYERNIYPLVIEDYNEIPEILGAIDFEVHRKRVFVSGSHPNDKHNSFCNALGTALAERDYVIVSASGKNVAEYVMAGAMKVLLKKTKHMRIILNYILGQ